MTNRLVYLDGTFMGAKIRFMVNSRASHNYVSANFLDYHGILKHESTTEKGYCTLPSRAINVRIRWKGVVGRHEP